MMDKAGLYYHKPYDSGDRQLHAGTIRHWRRKLITIGEKKFLRFYPARMDYSQPRCIRNRISRESQKAWNNRTRKETCRFLFLNNFNDGDLFVTLTFREEPAGMDALLNKKHYFIRKLNSLVGGNIKYLGCTETRNGNGDTVRPHLHMVISGASAAIIKTAWIYGNVHCVKLMEKHIDRVLEYMCKTFQYSEEKDHRYIRSRNLTPPDIEILKLDGSDYDDAAAVESIASDPAGYCEECFPEYEITGEFEVWQSEYLPGFYIRIELQRKKKKRKRRCSRFP